MKAIRVEEFGGPEVLKVAEVERPSPGEGEVLVEVRSIGVNYADTMRTFFETLSGRIVPSIFISDPGVPLDPPGSPNGAGDPGIDAAHLVTEDTAVTGSGGTSGNGATPPRATVTTRAQLEAVICEVRAAETVGVDLETTGLDPRSDLVRLVSLSTATDSWLVDCFEVDPRPLLSVLARKKLVMHNAAFDLAFLFAMSFELGEGGEVIDTMLISQVLESKEESL